MTNKKKRLVPQLRFKGFTNDWEQRKLENVLTESMISGTNGSIAKKLTVKLWGKGITPKSEVYRGSSSTKYYVRHSGQLMYGKLDFLHQAFGIVPARLDGFESTIDSPAFDISDSVNSNFLLNSILQRHFYLKEGMLANGSRKAKRINQDTFLAMKVWFPSLHEQNKIAKILQELDDTIALHQRKHGLLLKLKQGYLQRLFPENGSKIPELRLQGFTNDWEQRKLGELTEERTDRSSQGELLSVTMHDGIKKFKELGKKDNSSKNKSNYKVIKAGDIGYNSMRMWQGASGLSQWTGIVSPAYTIVKVGPQLNPQFLAYSFKRPTMIWNFQTHSQGLTSDTWNLKFPELSKLKLRFPNLEEQQEIVSLLSKLDDTIALHQKQLDQLKKLKQAYLQKLFV